MKNFYFTIITIIAFSFAANANTQSATATFATQLKNTTFAAATSAELVQGYIAQYKNLAIEEQYRTGIPASIKLSMGLLESSFGQSRLATEANNHFGIKWWNANDGAAFVEAMDDDKDANGKLIPSRFVKFASPEESYRKHSEFLLTRARYRVLFTYDRADYRAWATGLKACGYATAPDYAEKLIKLIEKYNLAQFDAPSTLAFDNATAATPAPAKTARVAVATPQYDITEAPSIASKAVVSQPVTRTVAVAKNTTSAATPQRSIESNRVENGQQVRFVLTEQ